MIKKSSITSLKDMVSFDRLFHPEPNYNSNQQSLGYVNKSMNRKIDPYVFTHN